MQTIFKPNVADERGAMPCTQVVYKGAKVKKSTPCGSTISIVLYRTRTTNHSKTSYCQRLKKMLCYSKCPKPVYDLPYPILPTPSQKTKRI